MELKYRFPEFTTVTNGKETTVKVSAGRWRGDVREHLISYDDGEVIEEWKCSGVKFPETSAEAPGQFTIFHDRKGWSVEGTTAEEARELYRLKTQQAEKEDEERRKAQEEHEADVKDEGFGEGQAWMEDYFFYRLGHTLDELAEHLPEIRKIFGDPEPDPERPRHHRGEDVKPQE